jgi:hypothetical protein
MNLDEIKELLTARIIFFLKPNLDKLHHYSIEDEGGKMEVIGATDDKVTSVFVLIRILISEEHRKIYITSLKLPDFMRHQGIGRKLIKVIYKLATELQFEVIITLMTDSFCESMKKRGALEFGGPNSVKIAESTMLE